MIGGFRNAYSVLPGNLVEQLTYCTVPYCQVMALWDLQSQPMKFYCPHGPQTPPSSSPDRPVAEISYAPLYPSTP